MPGPTTIPAETDDLQHIRVVAFDAFGTLVQINDHRSPWREIARRSICRIDARCTPSTLLEHAAACGVRWEPRWADLEAELQYIKPFEETGVQKGLSNAMLGRPMETVLQTLVAKPIFIDDEIEKAGRAKSSKGHAYGERSTAAVWNCPYFRLRFDFSWISWILTANDTGPMPLPLISRCQVEECQLWNSGISRTSSPAKAPSAACQKR